MLFQRVAEYQIKLAYPRSLELIPWDGYWFLDSSERGKGEKRESETLVFKTGWMWKFESCCAGASQTSRASVGSCSSAWDQPAHRNTLSVPFWAQILLLLWAPWLHKERLLNYTPWHIIVPDVFVGGLQPWTKIIADTKAEPWPLYWLKIRKWLSLSLSLSPGCYLCLCCQPRLSQSHAWSSLEMCQTANSGHYMSPGPCVSM